MRSRSVVGVLAATLTSVFLVGCSEVGGTGNLNYVAGDGQVREVAVADREGPVDVSGTTVDGTDLNIEDLKGQVVVVNLWWSGCVPCRVEMPMLVDAESELANDHPGKVSFVGINIRDSAAESAAAFERDMGVDYPSIYDPGSKTSLGFGKYQPVAPPTTWVLDTEGRVAAIVSGPIPSKSTLTTVVEDVVAETAK